MELLRRTREGEVEVKAEGPADVRMDIRFGHPGLWVVLFWRRIQAGFRLLHDDIISLNSTTRALDQCRHITTQAMLGVSQYGIHFFISTRADARRDVVDTVKSLESQEQREQKSRQKRQ